MTNFISRWSETSDVSVWNSDDEWGVNVNSCPVQTFLFTSYDDLLDKLCELDVQGYKVPDYLKETRDDWQGSFDTQDQPEGHDP